MRVVPEGPQVGFQDIFVQGSLLGELDSEPHGPGLRRGRVGDELQLSGGAVHAAEVDGIANVAAGDDGPERVHGPDERCLA